MSDFHPDIPAEFRNRIVNGDALALLLRLPDECIDAVITDPPYSSGGLFRSDRQVDTRLKYVPNTTPCTFAGFSGDNRDQRSFMYWSALWLSQCLRVTRLGGVVLTFTDWRQLPATTDAVQAGGWVWRGVVPWDKTEAARPDKGRYRNQCEYIVWGSKGQMPVPEDAPCLPGFMRLYQRPGEKVHIAGKPVGLIRQLLPIVPRSARGCGTTPRKRARIWPTRGTTSR